MTTPYLQNIVKWDHEALKRFKKVYNLNKKKEEFYFDGRLYVVGFAKYLIEYLEDRLPRA